MNDKATVLTREKLQFEAYHLPTLPAGQYTVTQQVTLDGHGLNEASLSFAVAGPRYSLSPEDILETFPPPDSRGEYDNVFPHVVLRRSTLPWERPTDATMDPKSALPRADGDHDGRVDGDRLPFLGLLLFTEAELQAKKVSLTPTTAEKAESLLHLSPESWIHDLSDKQVTLLTAEGDWLKTICPTPTELGWLAHVRMGTGQDGKRFERPTLVCNRRPTPGMANIVHLVSFESQGNGTGWKWDHDSSAPVTLLSLYQWRFEVPAIEHVKGKPRATFKGLADHLHRSAFTGVLPPSPPPLTGVEAGDEAHKARHKAATDAIEARRKALSAGLTFIDAGSMPVAHELRLGGKVLSWYRGPFVPMNNFDLEARLPLPVRNADVLLRYDTNTGMLDTSYGAAWTLGRQLILQDSQLSLKLLAWKKAHAQKVRTAESRLLHAHIPFQDQDFGTDRDASLSKTLAEHFASLELLEGVPFHYLVPDESFLPVESIRFFQLDPLWIEALLDGAFSLGRVTALDEKRDREAREDEATHTPNAARHPILSGILIRSELVSGWPGLMVEAYDERIEQDGQLPEDDKLGTLEVSAEDGESLVEGLRSYELPGKLRERLNGLITERARRATDIKKDWQTLSESITLTRRGPGDWMLIDDGNHEYYHIKWDPTQPSLTRFELFDVDRLPILRRVKLSDNVLLMLFKGIYQTVDIHLPAEHLHFGFIRPDEAHAGPFKELKQLTGEQRGCELKSGGESVAIPLSLRKGGATGLGVLDVVKTVTDMRKALKCTRFDSGEFSIEMIEGTPLVRFTAGPKGTAA